MFFCERRKKMAVIHSSNNELKRRIRKNNLTSLSAWIFFFVYMGFATTNDFFQLLFTLPLFFAMGMSYFFQYKNKILKVGLEGEVKALKLAKTLDDKYHVFTNKKITFQEQESELDLIVVGKTGVFVVEVKNFKGEIEGKEDERTWKQHKVGRKGTRYSQDFYSPVKQVGTHVYRLSKVLKEENIYTWVQGMVYFIHPDVKIDRVQSEGTPVLSPRNNFKNYIDNLESKVEMTDEKVDEIVTILKNHER